MCLLLENASHRFTYNYIKNSMQHKCVHEALLLALTLYGNASPMCKKMCYNSFMYYNMILSMFLQLTLIALNSPTSSTKCVLNPEIKIVDAQERMN